MEFMLQALHAVVADTRTDQVSVQVTDQVCRLLSALAEGEKTAADLL